MTKKNMPDGKERYEIEKSFKEVNEWFADEIPADKESHAIKSCLEYMKLMEQVVRSFFVSPCRFRVDILVATSKSRVKLRLQASHRCVFEKHFAARSLSASAGGPHKYTWELRARLPAEGFALEATTPNQTESDRIVVRSRSPLLLCIHREASSQSK